jgi:hypothetical protein
MEPVKRFRIVTVRFSTMIALVASAVAFPIDRVVAHALLLCGIGGILGFWIVAIQVEKLATSTSDKVHSLSFKWAFVRYLIFAAVLGRAFTLDRESIKGIIAGVCGLFIVQVVVGILGLTGWDRRAAARDTEGNTE